MNSGQSMHLNMNSIRLSTFQTNFPIEQSNFKKLIIL